MIWKTIASTFALAGICSLISAPIAIAQGAPVARGQNPPGAPGGRGAGMQLPPEMQAKLKAWQKWNEAHKPITELSTLMRKVERLDKEPGAELTKPQAVQLLAIMKPWRAKKEMTNDQASSVTKSVTKLLNPTQVAKLATMQVRGGGGMGGGGRRGGGGPGGGGPGGRGPGAPVGASGGPRLAGPGPAPNVSGSAPGGLGKPGGPGAGAPGGRMGGRPAGGPGGPGGFKIPDPPKGGFNPLNPASLPSEQQRPRAQKSMDEFTAALQAKAK